MHAPGSDRGSRWKAALGLLGAVVMAVPISLTSAAVAGSISGVGSPDPDAAGVAEVGGTYSGRTNGVHGGEPNPDRVMLFRLADVFNDDTLTVRGTAGDPHKICIVPEEHAQTPCFGSTLLTYKESTHELPVPLSSGRTFLRVESLMLGSSFRVTLESLHRPLSLRPSYHARGQRTDPISVYGKSRSGQAPDGLPCTAVVVGPDREIHRYRTKMRHGRASFDVDLDHLAGQRVGVIVGCDSSDVVTGWSFDVVK
jgi:hypothetical protein